MFLSALVESLLILLAAASAASLFAATGEERAAGGTFASAAASAYDFLDVVGACIAGRFDKAIWSIVQRGPR